MRSWRPWALLECTWHFRYWISLHELTSLVSNAIIQASHHPSPYSPVSTPPAYCWTQTRPEIQHEMWEDAVAAWPDQTDGVAYIEAHPVARGWLENTSTPLVNSSGEVVPGEVGNIYMCVLCVKPEPWCQCPLQLKLTAAVFVFYWDKCFFSNHHQAAFISWLAVRAQSYRKA